MSKLNWKTHTLLLSLGVPNAGVVEESWEIGETAAFTKKTEIVGVSFFFWFFKTYNGYEFQVKLGLKVEWTYVKNRPSYGIGRFLFCFQSLIILLL